MPRSVSDDELVEVYEAVKEHKSAEAASRALNKSSSTIKAQLNSAIHRFQWPDPRTDIVQGRGFRAYAPLDHNRSLEEILQHRRKEAARNLEYDDVVKQIRIDVKARGPIGIMVFGDPHIDNPGCDFPTLERHLAIAAKRSSYILAGNIGDLRDNWIGRLERLYAETTVNSKEIWKLVEWMMRGCGVHWMWLVRGNHDMWQTGAGGDPLDWISKGAGIGIDQAHGMRLKFVHPNGQETTMHARHDFAGNSIYNPLHALKRETLYGFRDNIIVAGHRHIGADAGDISGDGKAFQMIRVSGYKLADSYRMEKGLPSKPLHPAALIIVDPELQDGDRARAWCAPSVEEGADYLDWKRKRYNSRPRARARNPK
jgi:hypothetical protein